MSDENQVYFPLTGNETHGFIQVRLFADGGATRAEATLAGEMTAEADRHGLPLQGEPEQVLREVSDLAAVRGLDVRIQLDGVDWAPELGVLVK